jgi:hypothetical protein
MCHWCVPFEPFPLEVTVKVHRVLEILERLTGQIIADDGRAGSKHVLAAFVQPFFALPYNVVIDDFDRLFSTWSQESPVDFLGSFLSSYILQLQKNKFNYKIEKQQSKHVRQYLVFIHDVKKVVVALILLTDFAEPSEE